MTEKTQEAVDLERAKECLAAFSDSWDSSDIYILAAPVDEKGAITIDTEELGGGKFLHLGGTASLRVGNENYSVLLWDGGDPGGGVVVGEWEEGKAWAEIASESGAELLRGDYGVSVTGGSPIAFWARMVVAELWETDWRKPAPGNNRFRFPAYTASIETWKRIIRKSEQEVLVDGGNSVMLIAVPVAIGLGLTGLISWLVYRRNKLNSNEKSNIESLDQDPAVLAVIRDVRELWHDPVWSAVIAGVITAGILGILGLVASKVFGWFR